MEDIPGLAGIRRRLRTPSQADAARFEIEVLETFATAGLEPSVTGTPDCAISVRGQRYFVEIKQIQSPTRRSLLSSLRAKVAQLSRVAHTEFPCLVAVDLRRFPNSELVDHCEAIQQFLCVNPSLNGVIAWLPGETVAVLSRSRRWPVSGDVPLERVLRDLG